MYSSEPEFQQAYHEVVTSLEESKLFDIHPKYRKVLPVIAIPQRIIQFRVSWENDNGEQETTTGYRVQFNNALGPFKGGLRFHPSVNLSILKFLGFEQIFKNALSGQAIGGGKGGLCVDLKGRSDNEIRRICYAFMRELSLHIGKDTDIPAGDIGVGSREIGYMFGAFRHFRNSWEGAITGKGLDWGGSLIRPEATGYGLIYFAEEMMKYAVGKEHPFEGKRVLISGSGNVAQYAALKAISLGAIVLSLSDSKGTIICEEGISEEQVRAIAKGKLQFKSLNAIINESSDEALSLAKIKYFEGVRPWTQVKDNVDIAFPCATENELSDSDAIYLINKGVKFVAEGSNMGCSERAVEIFEEARLKSTDTNEQSVWYAPGKASNMGGVLVSALEMAQNSQRIPWSNEKVTNELKKGMVNAFMECIDASKKYSKEGDNGHILPSLVKGANLAGFIKVADAMFEQGDVY